MQDATFTVRPVGVVRSPFKEKVEAPRQAVVAHDVPAIVEVFPAYEHALADVATFERLWILFWFDRAETEGLRNKVQPPRSDRKRGIFATRSPHRPNPIGLSAVRLDRVEGRLLHVRDLDLLDGTPVLDVKPYLPYADAFPNAGAGWLDDRRADAAWSVAFTRDAEEQLAWIAERSQLDLRARVVAALSLGPAPLPYRRIKIASDGAVLAVKDWRVHFTAPASDATRTITVRRIATGYRPREIAAGTDPALALHRAFVARFVDGGAAQTEDVTPPRR